jgi:HAD superfamily phosphoserine phosphatase-like hydrolase
MKKRPVAVFDIDGTIFRSSLFLELVERLIDNGVFPKAARAMYEKERRLWLDRKGEYERYTEKAIAMFLKHIKGVPLAAVEEAAEELLREKKSRVYRYTRDLVRRLKKQGYYLLAISHSPRFVADIFGYEFGFDKIYGFFYETDANSRFTGKVVDIELIRNKAAVLRRAVRKEKLT